MRGVLTLVVLVGCLGPSGPEPVDATLRAQGTAEPVFEARGGWTVTLERAELALGPFYACPGSQAGDLCDVARAELLDAVRVDALDAAGTETPMVGVAATTRSAMFDYGVHWPLTNERPRVLDAARDGSVLVEGTIARGADTAQFRAALVLEPMRAGQFLVRASGAFDHELAQGDVLEVRVDARDWLVDVDWDALRDGAPDPNDLSFDEGTQATRALVQALTTTGRPSLNWR